MSLTASKCGWAHPFNSSLFFVRSRVTPTKPSVHVSSN
jgi:hypothetical protein